MHFDRFILYSKTLKLSNANICMGSAIIIKSYSIHFFPIAMLVLRLLAFQFFCMECFSI